MPKLWKVSGQHSHVQDSVGPKFSIVTRHWNMRTHICGIELSKDNFRKAKHIKMKGNYLEKPWKNNTKLKMDKKGSKGHP